MLRCRAENACGQAKVPGDPPGGARCRLPGSAAPAVRLSRAVLLDRDLIMGTNRTGTEELVFKTGEIDNALQDAGFLLAYADPEASRDFGYRARYIRGKSTPVPPAEREPRNTISRSKAFSLKDQPLDEPGAERSTRSSEEYRGDLQGAFCDRYFDSVREESRVSQAGGEEGPVTGARRHRRGPPYETGRRRAPV